MKILKKKSKEDFYKLFKPQLTPKKMLELGVFGGAYFGLSIKEYPKSWFVNAKISKNFDEIQIKRLKNFTRHVMAIKKNCEPLDLSCRRRQRQAILQWAYDPFI